MKVWVSLLCASSVLAISVSLPAEEKYRTHAEISHVGSVVHVAANDPRPLAQALDALQREYGWQINYEDPQYVSRGDLVEITNPPQARGGSASTHVHYPSGGVFDFDLLSAKMPLDEGSTLRLLVDAYNRTGNPGRFDLRESGDGKFDLVGTAANDPAGHIVRQHPVLDVPVTLAGPRGAASDIITSILAQVARQTHTKISSGVYPLSLQRTPVSVSGKKLPARMLLSQTLSATRRKFYWRLLYDPDSKTYFLSCMLPHPA